MSLLGSGELGALDITDEHPFGLQAVRDTPVPTPTGNSDPLFGCRPMNVCKNDTTERSWIEFVDEC